MNEVEKRRKQLLEQTRRQYGSSYTPPAIHPRYGRIYSNLYGKEEEGENRSGFGFRLFIAVLLFSLFAAMDYSGEKVGEVDSKRIVREIEKGVDVEEVWKKL